MNRVRKVIEIIWTILYCALRRGEVDNIRKIFDQVKNAVSKHTTNSALGRFYDAYSKAASYWHNLNPRLRYLTIGGFLALALIIPLAFGFQTVTGNLNTTTQQAELETQPSSQKEVALQGPASIFIDGKHLAVVSSEPEAKKIVQQAIDFFTTGQAENGMKVKEFTVKEKIEIRAAEGLEHVTPVVADIFKMLTTSKEEVITYQIQKGESLSLIAHKQKIPMNALVEANPGLIPERLQIGQEIKLVKPSFYINVKTTYIQEQKEEIPFPVQEIRDNSLGWSKAVVKEPGEKGLREATYLVIKENTETVNQELLEEKVIQEPKPRVVAKGDRYLVVSRGDKRYIYPTGTRTISSPYGPRWGSFHTGIDLATGTGAPIAASATGVVTAAGWAGGYGKQVVVDHGGGIKTSYAHLSSIMVGVGQRVEQGEVLGRSGATGNVTGPHLHFEFMVGGKFQNPINYIK